MTKKRIKIKLTFRVMQNVSLNGCNTQKETSGRMTKARMMTAAITRMKMRIARDFSFLLFCCFMLSYLVSGINRSNAWTVFCDLHGGRR